MLWQGHEPHVAAYDINGERPIGKEVDTTSIADAQYRGTELNFRKVNRRSREAPREMSSVGCFKHYVRRSMQDHSSLSEIDSSCFNSRFQEPRCQTAVALFPHINVRGCHDPTTICVTTGEA